MPAVAQLSIHASQFPANIRRALLESLRSRQVNHKFLYDSVSQSQKWLALHQAYAPSRTEPDCAAVYDRSFTAAAGRCTAVRVHLVGLGCGGGQKDRRLLTLLRDAGREAVYTPCDVSAALVLAARQEALAVIPEERCFPLVCDLALASDLPEVLDSMEREAARLFTFFGMIPNFEPRLILPRLAELVRPGDTLLFSANLAPGPDYAAGVRRILPLYDNSLTRDWLTGFLLELGVEREDGELRFTIEDPPDGEGLERVAAWFCFSRPREISVDAESVRFEAGERLRLFFSYRHTPERVRALLGRHGLQVVGEWITRSEEEGVFLVSRSAPE